MKRRSFIVHTGLSSISAAIFPFTNAERTNKKYSDEFENKIPVLSSENIVFPLDAQAVIDVTKAPYNCDNTGKNDCTDILNQILDDILSPTREAQKSLEKEIAEDPRDSFVHPASVENRKENGNVKVIFPSHPYPSRIIYFPNGIYKVSDTICYSFTDLHNSENNELNRQIIVRGQSQQGTIIRLKDKCPGFEKGKNKPVFSFIKKSGSNVAMVNFFENITIDTGIGNFGASGLRFFSNNTGAVRNVTIKSGDPTKSGSVGILCDKYNLSGCYFKNISVDGFDYGIQVLPYRMYTVFEHIQLQNQKISGFLVDETPVSIRGLISNNQVPALTITGQPAHVSLIDSELTFEENKYFNQSFNKNCPAVELVHGVLFARNTKIKGYISAVGRFGNEYLNGEYIDEYSSHGVYSLSENDNIRSLNLPIEETPEIPWEQDFNKWISVNSFGAKGDEVTDDTKSIQKALNSGKKVIYFQPGRYLINGQLTIPKTVHRINFMFCDLLAGDNLHELENQGTFKINEDSVEPLIVEDLFAFEDYRGKQYFIEHASTRTLILSDLHTQTGAMYINSVSGGKVFIENICCTDQFQPNPNCYRFNGQTVWARQLNPERANPEVLNNGSTLWVLGFKTEGRGTGFATRNGGSTEVLGGVINMGWDDNPFIINENSKTSIVCASNAANNKQVFRDFALEIKKDSEEIFDWKPFPKRILFRGDYYSFKKTHYVEQFFVPLYVGNTMEH